MNGDTFDVIISIMKSDALRELAKDELFTKLDNDHKGFSNAYDTIDSDYMNDTINEVVKDTLRFVVDMVENNIRKYINEDIDASLSRVITDMSDEMLCDEKFLEGYYDVEIIRNDNVVDGFLDYGSPDNIASHMDAYMESNHPDDDWNEFSARVSYDGMLVLTMPNLRLGPDYDIEASIDDLLDLRKTLTA